MSNFKIKLKLTGFELEIEGNRDELPLIADSVSQQIVGLLEPATNIVEGSTTPSEETRQLNPPLSKRVRRSQRKTQSRKDDLINNEQAIDLQIDPSKWGTPQQSWNTANKSIWLLYVIGQEQNVNEISGICLSKTFNKHFRQAKEILVNNVNRDLGKMKVKPKALVAEITNSVPTKWYLTQEGMKFAQELVQQAKGLENGIN